MDISGFLNVTAHFKRMEERPSVKKLLAHEKEVNEAFAKTAYLACYRYQFRSSAVTQSWTVESFT